MYFKTCKIIVLSTVVSGRCDGPRYAHYRSPPRMRGEESEDIYILYINIYIYIKYSYYVSVDPGGDDAIELNSPELT